MLNCQRREFSCSALGLLWVFLFVYLFGGGCLFEYVVWFSFVVWWCVFGVLVLFIFFGLSGFCLVWVVLLGYFFSI